MKNLIILSLLLLVSCARAPLKSPKEAMRLTSQPDHFSDDLNLKDYIKALKINISLLKKQKKRSLSFGPKKIAAPKYAHSLQRIVDFYENNREKQAVLNFIAENFEWHEVYGNDDYSEIMLTSYYEPLYEGRLKPEAPYTQPIYGLPSDLIEIDIKSFAALKNFKYSRSKVGARLVKSKAPFPKAIPYYSRKEIDVDKVLKGKKKELYYLDPLHAFFLQIQGSGMVRLKSGEIRRVGYAGQNGHRYESIGKYLFHVIPKEEMSLQKIEAHLRTLPLDELYEFLNVNPSYVFFRNLKKGRGRTTLGTEVVSGRTIAVDSSLFPLGAIGHLVFQKPQFEDASSTNPIGFEDTSRLILAQDTGGAIKSAGRADLFWGEGSSALQYAGVMKHKAKLWFLFPKE